MIIMIIIIIIIIIIRLVASRPAHGAQFSDVTHRPRWRRGGYITEKAARRIWNHDF
jgi:hypothetical protein